MEKKSILDPMPFTVDDFFTTQAQRDDAKKEKIEEIDLSLLDEFPNHPFKVLNNDELDKLKESIKSNGVLEPIIVRKKDDRYEIVSGHRRKLASQLVGLKTMPCIIRNMNNDEATIYMVDSNMHREEILPSEKARAYKMKLDALNHQGKTSGQVGLKVQTRDEVGEVQGDSGRQVQRYIRLTKLIQEILDMVDEKKIAFRPAVEISYLSEDNQYVLLDVMQFSDITPSLAQAIHMKKLEQEGKLDTEKIEDLMSQEKPNQVEKLKFNAERFESVFPKNIKTNQEKEDFIYMCVEEHNQRERAKKRAMER